MKSHHFSALFLTAACLAFPGCADDPAPVEAADLDVPFEPADGPDIKNGTGAHDMFDVYILQMLLELRAGKIADTAGRVRLTPSMAAAPEASRRKVLKDLVECALGDSDTVTDPLDDTRYYGHVGLAPSWLSSDLSSVSDQRYVSACLLQHLNAYGIEVCILLEGEPSQIRPDPVLREDYRATDSILWGNLLAPDPKVYACALPDVTAACLEPEWVDGINHRVCDTEALCDLTIVGPCEASCVEDPITGVWSCPYWGYTEVIASRTRLEDAAYVCGL